MRDNAFRDMDGKLTKTLFGSIPLPRFTAPVEASFFKAIRTHENNFNLIRIILATTVMFYHAFALNTAARGSLDPASAVLSKFAGIDLGRLAVDMFFVISGVFVCKSWLEDPNLARFGARRVTRLIPGLLFCSLILGLAAMLFFADGGGAPIFKSAPWIFLLKTSFLADVPNWHISAEYIPVLPGVFPALDIKIFNGSLWSLIWEARFYIIFAVMGVAASLSSLNRTISLAAVSLLLLALMVFSPRLIKLFVWEFDLFSCFLVGAIITCAARLLGPSIWIACFALGGVTSYFEHLAGVLIVIGAVLLWLGSARFLFFKSLVNNDYSYGIYIYHWPIMQMIRSTFSPLTPLELFILTATIALPMAAISWRFIERPSMKWVRRFLRRSKDASGPNVAQHGAGQGVPRMSTPAKAKAEP